MATFTPFHEFKRYLADGTIDLDTHTFKMILTNTAVNAATNTVLADLTEISAAGGYAAKSLTCSWAETGAGVGTWRFSISADQVWTASGAAFDAFRYVVIYDDTPVSPADPLVGYLDYGSAVTLNDTETFTVDVDANGSIFTLS